MVSIQAFAFQTGQRVRRYVEVPADAGYGGGVSGNGGGTAAVTSAGFHDKHDNIVLELGFNRPTWLADSASCNHESFVLDMILPRVLGRGCTS